MTFSCKEAKKLEKLGPDNEPAQMGQIESLDAAISVTGDRWLFESVVS
jgi:hypothetical protein